MNVLDLFAKLTLDSTEYEKGLGDSEEKAEKFGASLKNALGTAAKVTAAGVATVTTAIVATGTALVKGAGDVATYGDNIDKMSQKLGMSAEAYQEWDAIMQHSGTSIEAMQAGMKTLATAAETGNKAFEELGITQEELATLDQEALFARTIEALQNVESDTQRTYLAGQLLGRGATELGALLNTSAEDTEAMRQRVHELGGVMSDEAVKAAAAYQDSLQDMTTAFSGLSRGLMADFLPGVQTTMDGLTEIFSGDTGGGLEIVSTGIDSIVSAMTERLPQFLTVGFGIIEAIGTAIIDNLPEISNASVQIILQIVQFLVQAAPQLIEAGTQIILALANGLIDALPELIPAVVEAILTIVEKLTEPDTLLQLIGAALQIILALGEGLIRAIPQLLEAVPVVLENLIDAVLGFLDQVVETGGELIAALAEGILEKAQEVYDSITEIISNVKQSISDTVRDALEWGRDLINNFVAGITEKWEALKSKVSGVAQTVRDFLGFSEPKEGPLSNFHTFAPDMMELYAKGIKDNAGLVTSQLDSLARDARESLTVSSAGFGAQGSRPAATGRDTAKLEELMRENTAMLRQIAGEFSGLRVKGRMAM